MLSCLRDSNSALVLAVALSTAIAAVLGGCVENTTPSGEKDYGGLARSTPVTHDIVEPENKTYNTHGELNSLKPENKSFASKVTVSVSESSAGNSECREYISIKSRRLYDLCRQLETINARLHRGQHILRMAGRDFPTESINLPDLRDSVNSFVSRYSEFSNCSMVFRAYISGSLRSNLTVCASDFRNVSDELRSKLRATRNLSAEAVKAAEDICRNSTSPIPYSKINTDLLNQPFTMEDVVCIRFPNFTEPYFVLKSENVVYLEDVHYLSAYVTILPYRMQELEYYIKKLKEIFCPYCYRGTLLYVISPYNLVTQYQCPENKTGCAYRGVVIATDTPHIHELVHAISIDPPSKFIKEGIAEYFTFYNHSTHLSLLKPDKNLHVYYIEPGDFVFFYENTPYKVIYTHKDKIRKSIFQNLDCAYDDSKCPTRIEDRHLLYYFVGHLFIHYLLLRDPASLNKMFKINEDLLKIGNITYRMPDYIVKNYTRTCTTNTSEECVKEVENYARAVELIHNQNNCRTKSSKCTEVNQREFNCTVTRACPNTERQKLVQKYESTKSELQNILKAKVLEFKKELLTEMSRKPCKLPESNYSLASKLCKPLFE